ncbi:hypothetical protein ABH903_001631 [Brevibacterium epidermidis]|jgi:hypothetical protein|uniref:Uncharacterized protein n=1 Tax=Brevibacterium epidermidis TaxID=1698 RepID=A0ABV4EJA0_BREEP
MIDCRLTPTQPTWPVSNEDRNTPNMSRKTLNTGREMSNLHRITPKEN